MNVKESEYVQNTIRVWDLKTGKCEHALRRQTSTAESVATFVLNVKPKILSGSGIYLYSEANKDGEIYIWDTKTGKCEQVLSGHKASVKAVASCVVDEKTKLVSASYGKTVRIWDAETGECEHVLKGHEDSVTSVACLAGGRQIKIASGSLDSVVRVWNVHSGECEHILEGPLATLDG